MSTPSEEEARAAAEAHFPHGDVRPYATRHFIAGYLAALASRVSTPPSGPSLARVLEAIAAQREWFIEASDDVLSRIKTDTTEDVRLYHDAVSVLVAARGVYDLIAGLAVSTPPSETVEWIDRTLALPCYQDVPADSYAEGITDTLKTIRKLLTAVPAVPAPPTEPETLAPMSPVFEDALTDDEWVERRLAAPTEPEEKR